MSYLDVLAGRTETIVSHVVETTAGITVVSSVNTTNNVKVVISGGTTGQSYKVTTLATSSAGLVYEDDFLLLVEEL